MSYAVRGGGDGSALSFGMAFVLEDQFTSVANKIESSMTRLYASNDRFSSGINREFQKASNMAQSGVASINSAFKIFEAGTDALENASIFERGKLQLDTFLGNAEAAAEALKDIKQDALKVPIAGFKDMLQATNLLVSSGKAIKAAREETMALANAVMLTGGNAYNLENVAYNYNEIFQNGKASKKDLKQFSAAHLNFASTYQKLFGKSPLRDDVKVTAEQTRYVFKYLMDNYNVVDKISKSISGQMAMIRENNQYLSASFGKAIAPTFLMMSTRFNQFAEAFSAFIETPIGSFITQLVAVGGAIAGLSLLSFGLYKLFTAAFGLAMASRVKVMTSMIKGMFGVSKLFAFGSMTDTRYRRMIHVLRNMRDTVADTSRFLSGNIISSFVRLGVAFSMINSNSEFLVTLGTVLAVMAGPLGIIGALVIHIYRGFESWKKFTQGTISDLTGLQGHFIKLGGYMASASEIMATMKGDTFQLSSELIVQLERAGMLDGVLNMARAFMFVRDVIKDTVYWLEVMFTPIKMVVSLLDSILVGISSLFGGDSRGASALQSSVVSITTSMLGFLAATFIVMKSIGIFGSLLKVGVIDPFVNTGRAMKSLHDKFKAKFIAPPIGKDEELPRVPIAPEGRHGFAWGALRDRIDAGKNYLGRIGDKIAGGISAAFKTTKGIFSISFADKIKGAYTDFFNKSKEFFKRFNKGAELLAARDMAIQSRNYADAAAGTKFHAALSANADRMQARFEQVQRQSFFGTKFYDGIRNFKASVSNAFLNAKDRIRNFFSTSKASQAIDASLKSKLIGSGFAMMGSAQNQAFSADNMLKVKRMIALNNAVNGDGISISDKLKDIRKSVGVGSAAQTFQSTGLRYSLAGAAINGITGNFAAAGADLLGGVMERALESEFANKMAGRINVGLMSVREAIIKGFSASKLVLSTIVSTIVTTSSSVIATIMSSSAAQVTLIGAVVAAIAGLVYWLGFTENSVLTEANQAAPDGNAFKRPIGGYIGAVQPTDYNELLNRKFDAMTPPSGVTDGAYGSIGGNGTLSIDLNIDGTTLMNKLIKLSDFDESRSRI